MVGNKQISCKICSKAMRSDNLKSHMKIHGDLSSEDPKQLCKDIKSIKDETSMYMEKPKVNDLHSDGLNILEDGLDETPGDEIDDKELKKRLAHDNKQKRDEKYMK